MEEHLPDQSSSRPDATSQMGTDAIGRLLLRFSIPAIGGMLVQALYNIVDRMFIGRGIGADGLASCLAAPLTISLLQRLRDHISQP